MTSNFIHRFVPAMTPDAPTILALHGTGGDESDLIPLAKAIAPHAAVLSPRGKVLEGGAPRFFRRLAEGVFDLPDLQRRTTELAQFVMDAAAEYRFDPVRVYAVGYSNGANIAASLLLSAPTILAGAVLLRPMLPFEPDAPPDLRGKPVLVSAGRYDPIVPAALTDQLAHLLTASGAIVTSRWYDAGHALTPGEIDDAAGWFAALKIAG